jgi:hypothetical protein
VRITGSRPNLSASRLPVIVPAAPAISIVVSAASPSCLPRAGRCRRRGPAARTAECVERLMDPRGELAAAITDLTGGGRVDHAGHDRFLFLSSLRQRHAPRRDGRSRWLRISRC